MLLALTLACAAEVVDAAELSQEELVEETSEDRTSTTINKVYRSNEEIDALFENTTSVLDENGNIDWSLFKSDDISMDEIYYGEVNITFSANIEQSVMKDCQGIGIKFTDGGGALSEMILSNINGYTTTVSLMPSVYTIEDVEIKGYEGDYNIDISPDF